MAPVEDDFPAVVPPPARPPERAGLSPEDADRLRTILRELYQRKYSALRLYEPLPVLDEFHRSAADERLVRGSNRAGKTLGSAVEVARAVTGQDPHGKYPPRDGRCFAIGLDEKHLADVMYRKLFRAGAYKIIRDERTGRWRAFRPAEDAARRREAKPAPPLIPARFVRDVAWKDKKRGVPDKVTLINGWEINFYSSKGQPPQGSDIDLAWIDEECENRLWYSELSARLLDRKGKFVWSATPQVANPDLYNLHCRCEDGDPKVREFVTLLEDNPHIDDDEKAKLAEKLSPEERRVRIKGEFAMTGFIVYPEFDHGVHGVPFFQLPHDWCCYAYIDPGRQVCAGLFGAVPPPDHELSGDVVVFDEFYVRNCDAQKFGDVMKEKTAGRVFQAFVIDSRAGRVTEMGSGMSVEDQYSRALKERGVKSVATAHGFVWGADDPKAGIQAVHAMLHVRPNGRPRLRVFRETTPNLAHEMERYHYRRDPVTRLPTDEPEKRNDHLVDCLRYLAMHDPGYVKPPKHKLPLSGAAAALKAKKERRRRKEGAGGRYVRLGPGRAA